MEVKINGMPKEIADFLKEIENRPMYSKPTAHTHSMPSVSPGTYCHSVPSVSPGTHCHSMPSISSGTHCHSMLTPNSNEQGKTYMEQCREYLNRAAELGFDPLIGFPAPPGWEPDVVDKDPKR